MSENEDDFRNIVGGLNPDAAPDPAHKEKLRRQMLAEFAKAAEETKAGRLKRRILNSRLAKYAIAASIAAAVMLGLYSISGTLDITASAFAIDAVIDAVENVEWMRATWYTQTSADPADRKYLLEYWICIADNLYICKEPDGAIQFRYESANRWESYDPNSRTITITDKLSSYKDIPPDLAQYFLRKFEQMAAQGKKIEYLDTFHEQHMVRLIKADCTIETGVSYEISLMAAADTHLPMQITIRRPDASAADSVAVALIDYPSEGPSNIYEAGAPDNAIVKDTTVPSSDWVSVPPQLPEPTFIGTPVSFADVENLEKPLGRPRPAFLAPRGVVNVAQGKPVISSDDIPTIGKLEYVTNGDMTASDNTYVELGPGVQYVTIDLQSEYYLYAVVVWHYHKFARVYKDVVVQISDDADFTSNVRTLFNNDDDNSAGLGAGNDKHYVETSEGKLVDAKGLRARYVRLYSNGNFSNDLNHYTEVEVFGKPIED